MTMRSVLLLALAVTSLAKPLALNPRDDIAPPIINPDAQTVWRSGETQTVTWDLSGLNGVSPSNPSASIILGTFINGEERLMVDSPLVTGFLILGGNVSLVVPTVPPGSNYIVCLLGSSRDISAPFTILGTDSTTDVMSTASKPRNTLPPHQTTDRTTTTTSLPPGATRTDPGTTSPTPPSLPISSSFTSTPPVSTPTPIPPSSPSSPISPSSPSSNPSSASTPSPPASVPSGTSPSDTTGTTPSLPANATSSDTSTTVVPTGGTGNGAEGLVLSHLRLLAVLGVSALWAFL